MELRKPADLVARKSHQDVEVNLADPIADQSLQTLEPEQFSSRVFRDHEVLNILNIAERDVLDGVRTWRKRESCKLVQKMAGLWSNSRSPTQDNRPQPVRL